MSVGILFLIISVASANNAQRRALSEHFTTILKEKGSSTKAWPLPVPARFAATLLHLHTPLIFDDDDEAQADAKLQMMLREERDKHAAHNRPTTHVLCGSQRDAVPIRSALAPFVHHRRRVKVSFASRTSDVACWELSLHLTDADKLASQTKLFFHVLPIPSAAKIPRHLVITNDVHDELRAADGVFSTGLPRHARLSAMLTSQGDGGSAFVAELRARGLGLDSSATTMMTPADLLAPGARLERRA